MHVCVTVLLLLLHWSSFCSSWVLQTLTTTFVLQAEAADLQVKSDSRRFRGVAAVAATLCSPLTAAVSAHQYPAFKSSDTENFSLSLDMDEEDDDLSTDEDEDVSFPLVAAAAQLLPPPVSLTKFHHLFFLFFNFFVRI